MSNARNLARVIVDSSGDIAAGNLDNAVPADGSITAAKLAATLDLSSKTLTYPDNSVQSADIASLAASKLTGQVPDANAPSGSVIQVVSATKVDSFSSTSSSFVDVPGLSVSITPSSSTSRILVFSVTMVSGDTWSTGGVRLNLVRNSTNLSVGTSGSVNSTSGYNAWSSSVGNTQGNFSPVSIVFLDSPATTSSTTYKIQGANAGSATWQVNRRDYDSSFAFSSSITVMEIAA